MSDNKTESNDLLKYTPKWLKIIIAVLFIYGIINFLLCMSLNNSAGPEICNGEYTLSSHGRIVKKLTKKEYEKAIAIERRLISGHWIIFYAISFTALQGIIVALKRIKSGELK